MFPLLSMSAETSTMESVENSEYICVDKDESLEDDASQDVASQDEVQGDDVQDEVQGDDAQDADDEDADEVQDDDAPDDDAPDDEDADDDAPDDEDADEDAAKEKEMLKNFTKIIQDFTKDILTTFPELNENLNAHLVEIVTNETPNKDSVDALLKHCLAVFPVKFFDILYQNNDLFDSEEELVFLPEIDFRVLWKENISDKTRESIWRYLQLILFTIVSGINNTQSFGDTAKLFEAIDEVAFKQKL